MWQIEMCHRCKLHWGPSGERMQNSHHWPLILITCWNDNVVDTFSSVQFSRSVVSDSLRPHESQHARPPYPSQTPGVHPDSRPSSWWCHPAISSSVVPFSSCPQSLPASESFPMSQLFAWGGPSTGVSGFSKLVYFYSTLKWHVRSANFLRLCFQRLLGQWLTIGTIL